MRVSALVFVLCGLAPAASAQSVEATDVLRPATRFGTIANRHDRSIALFREASKVIQGPRCLNCHPVGSSPTQADAMRPHIPLVVRGADGHGAAAMHCVTCHQADNTAASSVPGQAKWQLAPASMAWQTKSTGEICRAIKDVTRNGGRNLDAVVEHMAHDPLVGWAWLPGGNRSPALGSQAQFGELIRAWVQSGAVCPSG